MPHVAIRLPHGRFSPEAQAALAKRLTSSVLAAEGLPETDVHRSLCWIDISESAPGAWTVAAEPAEQRAELHAFARVTTLQGLLTDHQRAALHAAINEAIVEAAGGDELGGLGVWTVIDERPDGSFGAAGGVVTADLLRATVG